MRTIAIIPARGGSKGIPKKNLADLGGYPLVAWPILSAMQISCIDDVYLSTDDANIAAAGMKYGATILNRPIQLAGDESRVVDMIQHHLDDLLALPAPPQIVVYLEPTSPFRSNQEIMDCVDLLGKKDIDSAATFALAPTHPTSHRLIADDGLLKHTSWLRHDKRVDSYFLTGAVYVFRVSSFLEKKPAGIFFGKTGCVLQDSPPIDIDTITDLEIARAFAQHYPLPNTLDE